MPTSWQTSHWTATLAVRDSVDDILHLLVEPPAEGAFDRGPRALFDQHDRRRDRARDAPPEAPVPGNDAFALEAGEGRPALARALVVADRAEFEVRRVDDEPLLLP